MANQNHKLIDIGRSVQSFFCAVGEIPARGCDVIGCGIQDGCYWLGKKTGGTQLLQWLGGILKGVFPVIATLFKGAFGIVGGIFSGSIHLVLGIISFNKMQLRLALEDFLIPTFGFIVIFIGKLIAHLQSLFYLQSFERPLTQEEKQKLQLVLQGSANLYIIRIIEGHSGIFDLTPRAFTLGNTLYLKTKDFDEDLLIHEAMHSWQYQRLGIRYALDALLAQWFVPDAYNWKKELEERNKERWQDFNMESQAEFIEYLWQWGHNTGKDGRMIDFGKGSFFTADDQSLFGKFVVYGEDFTLIAAQATSKIRKKLL